MMNLNNKGQSLVMFVLLLPILLLVMVLVVDIGRFICDRQELDSICNIVLDYGLDNYDDVDIENKMVNLIILNDKDLNDINVNISNENIYVKITKKDSSIFGNMFNIHLFNVNSYYVGDITSKKIERIK